MTRQSDQLPWVERPQFERAVAEAERANNEAARWQEMAGIAEQELQNVGWRILRHRTYSFGATAFGILAFWWGVK